MRRLSLTVAFIAICFASPTFCRGDGESDRDDVRHGLEDGGWKVAYGKEIDSKEAFKGGVASYYGGPAGFELWLTALIEETVRKLEGEARDKFTPEAQKAVIPFLKDTLLRLIEDKGGEERLDSRGFNIKAGIAQYKWKEKVFGRVIYTLPSFEPYIGIRVVDSFRPPKCSQSKDARADADRIGTDEQFHLVAQADGTVALQCVVSGRFVRAEEGGGTGKDARADADRVGPHERFRIVTLGSDLVALRCASVSAEVYLRAEDGGGTGKDLRADATKIGDHEKFRLVQIDEASGRVALQCFVSKKYIRAEDGGGRPRTRHYVRAEDGGGTGKDARCDANRIGPHEQFVVKKLSNGNIALQATVSKRFIRAEQGGGPSRDARCDADNVGPDEQFQLVPKDDGWWALRCLVSQKFLRGNGGDGKDLRADADQVGDFERFRLLPLTSRESPGLGRDISDGDIIVLQCFGITE